MSQTSASNDHSPPNAEELAAIAVLARAMGRGCVKLREALVWAYGENDQRCRRAEQIDQHLQPLIDDLEQDSQWTGSNNRPS
jgi:hypothetical protein